MTTPIRLSTASLLLTALLSSGALAEDSLWRKSLIVDCAQPTLPSQREVGELLGLQNFRQVYARRVSLMGEVHRACHRSHAESVILVFEGTDGVEIQGGLVASNAWDTR